MNRYDVIVVGGGVAGLTAASYVSRSNKSVAVFEKGYYFGGLVNTFDRKGFKFDSGLRSIENSGIIFPMIRDLGLKLDFVKSTVSIVTDNRVLKLKGTESINDYSVFLKKEFPKNSDDIDKIIGEIKKITEYMDVLYGIDNPLFLDFKRDQKYFINVIFPWMFKFLITIGKINNLNEPVNDYLAHFTSNKELIDNISQHFFKDTPTSFALSYFSLYNDYNYPVGGTVALPNAMVDYITKNGGSLFKSCGIESVNITEKFVEDSKGEKHFYKKLIWACDLKFLYKSIDKTGNINRSIIKKIKNREDSLNRNTAAESVYAIYISSDLPCEYFKEIASEHVFYTPHKDGLSIVSNLKKDATKEEIKEYLKNYVKYNTFEISIPAIRDKNLSPEGQTGLEISLLFDYNLTKKIVESGWKKEFKKFMEELILNQLKKLYPKLNDSIISIFSSTPLTMERYTSNSQGALIGWSFTNRVIPVEHTFLTVGKSVSTPIKDVYKCGQWAYSPSGLPISVLTGKLAADKVTK